jgi:hypothetical protein
MRRTTADLALISCSASAVSPSEAGRAAALNMSLIPLLTGAALDSDRLAENCGASAVAPEAFTIGGTLRQVQSVHRLAGVLDAALPKCSRVFCSSRTDKVQGLHANAGGSISKTDRPAIAAPRMRQIGGGDKGCALIRDTADPFVQGRNSDRRRNFAPQIFAKRAFKRPASSLSPFPSRASGPAGGSAIIAQAHIRSARQVAPSQASSCPFP